MIILAKLLNNMFMRASSKQALGSQTKQKNIWLSCVQFHISASFLCVFFLFLTHNNLCCPLLLAADKSNYDGLFQSNLFISSKIVSRGSTCGKHQTKYKCQRKMDSSRIWTSNLETSSLGNPFTVLYSSSSLKQNCSSVNMYLLTKQLI